MHAVTSPAITCPVAVAFAYHLECSSDAISGCRSSSKGRGGRWIWIFSLVGDLAGLVPEYVEKFFVREFKGGRRRLALEKCRAGPCIADADVDFNATCTVI